MRARPDQPPSADGATAVPSRLELWGGLEPTIARINDSYRDQCAETGHRDRIEDLDRIAELGIRTLRYPVIWESVSPKRPDLYDWRWHDERLSRLQALELRPIAGLLHHGSGPIYTNLLDPAFPQLFADYAGQVARRYTWIEHYTPVNEPLTTARFSALYGHWYPHQRSDRAFLQALLAECTATVLSMRAIRTVCPGAKLVQTDDFGRVFSTPALAPQAEHENERRWLTFDLLAGRVDRDHPLWSFLLAHGIGEQQLEVFQEADCAPDIIGINHYLTSERYLDERLEAYPRVFWGGNGRQSYADVEAVRVPNPGGELGPEARLLEVWNRYQRPIAITEVHHGCTRDEQLRWLAEVWRGAQAARAEGADIRAVTVWSLFGAIDWNSLLTRRDGVYEPGAFDVRGPRPRPTALAQAARALASKGEFHHPVLDGVGWWHRSSRFYNPDTPVAGEAQDPARQVVILGESSPLTDAFARIATVRGLAHRVCQLDGAATLDPGTVWAVIDTGGAGSAELALPDGLRHVRIETPRVSGDLGRAYCEADLPEVCGPGTLTIRTGPIFGPWDRDTFAIRMMEALAAGRAIQASDDIVSPAYLPDLAHVILDLLIDGETGPWHLFNPGAISGRAFVETLGSKSGLTVQHRSAPGPVRILALETERGRLLAPLTNAIDRFLAEADLPRHNEPMPLAAE